MKLKVMCLAVTAVLTASAPAAWADDHDVTEIRLELEAGSGFFKPWTSGQTYHSGLGYFKPYGAASYFCGTNYTEALGHSVPDTVKTWLKTISNDENPLFCIYRLPGGDIYTYDVVIGTVLKTPDNDGVIGELINIVVGGTGAYQNADGIWTGTAQGRGQLKSIRSDWRLPDTIIKSMSGYVRTPPQRK